MAPKKETGESPGAVVKRGRGRPPKRGRGGGRHSGGSTRGGGENSAVAMDEDRESLSPTRSDSPVGSIFYFNRLGILSGFPGPLRMHWKAMALSASFFISLELIKDWEVRQGCRQW